MNFLLNKVLLRSLTATVGPLILYTPIFFLLKETEIIPDDTKFFNVPFIIALVGVSVIISKIGLWFTLRPVEKIFDWLLWVEPGKNWTQKGNFAPIKDELQFEIEENMINEGKVPDDINGVYLRNGPNPIFFPPHNRHHWFDGDGHIHGLRLKNGKAFYCNRQTLSNQHLDHMKLNRQVNLRLGAFNCLPGLFQASLFDFEKQIGYLPDHHQFKRFNANTAITNHAKRTFALIEADFPFEVKVDKDAKEFDIKSVGYDDFDGQLEHHVSAHPKVDRKTGHFMAFAYDRFIPFVNCSYFDSKRNLVSYSKIPIASCRMLHDFVNTEHYIVIPDLPMEGNPQNCINGKWFYQLNKEKPARYGILKRGDTNGETNTKWFELPSHYCFHFANAWEEKNDKGEELVIVWGCRADEIDAEFKVEHPFLASEYKTKTTRFEFNLETLESKMDAYAPDYSVEFPAINFNEHGYKTKYLYFGISFTTIAEDSQACRDNVMYPGFIKFDTETRTVVGEVLFGPRKTGGEIFFQPRDNATSEDDGYCMTFVHHWETNSSEFIMWDAKTMSNTPVFRAQLKQRVPNGFHGMFVQEQDMN